MKSTLLFSTGVLIGGAASAALLNFFNRRRSLKPALECSNPHPQWGPGQKQKPPWGDDSAFMSLDPQQMEPVSIYALVISAVVPRPIGFVSTLNGQGVGNLAPFSYFNIISHNPPCVVISVCASGARNGSMKDTAQNILETGEFVVNIISEWFVEAANHTCGNYDHGIDEMQLASLTPEASVKVSPPRVKESAFHMECKVRHTHKIETKEGKPHATVIIGEVVMFHMQEKATGRSPTGKIVLDVTKYCPMSRLGGNFYGRTSSFFDLPRPDRSLQDAAGQTKP